MFTGIIEEQGRVVHVGHGVLRIDAHEVLGDVTVDGISLTVVKPLDDGFTAAIIPHTAAVTSLGHKGASARVNIEVDVLAKYVERLLNEQR